MRAGANVKRQGLCMGSCFRLMQKEPMLGRARAGVLALAWLSAVINVVITLLRLLQDKGCCNG